MCVYVWVGSVYVVRMLISTLDNGLFKVKAWSQAITSHCTQFVESYVQILVL
jgi:hypothetical protein